ncbi:hypothetical protein JL720_4224 [Aureococcus anophagefferens]|nr:hypothetical protein JL720_4224 [Aureococcus anophagefferens]
MADTEEKDDEKAGDDEMGTYTPSQIDIDAIASAKSLGDAMRLLAPQLEGLPRRSRGKYGKRKHLTPEEKAELTRRRKNERSTRMRRKMYIKHLQQVAETLKERHDELNSKMAAPPPDGYTRRRDAVRRFLELRGAVPRPSSWREVLGDGFVLTLPPTPYRAYPDEELRQPSVRTANARRGLDKKRKRASPPCGPAGLAYEVDRAPSSTRRRRAPRTVSVEDPAGLVSATHAGMAKHLRPGPHAAAVHLRFDAATVHATPGPESAPAPPPS